jgi:hypothetical protein
LKGLTTTEPIFKIGSKISTTLYIGDSQYIAEYLRDDLSEKMRNKTPIIVNNTNFKMLLSEVCLDSSFEFEGITYDHKIYRLTVKGEFI